MVESADRSPARRILVVEDAPEVARLVQSNLADLGHAVTVIGDGAEALERAQRDPFDLIILDLMLPGLDGLEVCRALRAAGNRTPILILTAKGTELDRIVGLEFGADDYMVKPFSVLELLARVKALFRRLEMTAPQKPQRGEQKVRFGEFVIDPVARELLRSGEPVPLTAKEFDLLLMFARNPGRVYSRGQLLEQVWGYGGGVYEATVTSHINRLRSKIEADPANPAYIETVWGVGYRFFPGTRDR